MTGQTFIVEVIPPSKWKWEPAFQEALLNWLRELRRMPGTGQVTLIERALHFEAHRGRSMPASPGAALRATVRSLNERVRVLRRAPSVLNKHVAPGARVQGTTTHRARSLVSLGAGPLAGLTARTYFTRRYGMMHQLHALASYCEGQWAAKIGQGQGFHL